MRFFDTGANLNVESYKGIYQKDVYFHEPDMKFVLERS